MGSQWHLPLNPAPQVASVVPVPSLVFDLICVAEGSDDHHIEWQDQFGYWRHYQTKQNQADAYRVASRRASASGKRHRLVDGDGRLLDLID